MFESLKAVSEKKYIKMLLFGYAGVGKTVFGLSHPGKGYLIDFERGAAQYADVFDNISTVSVSKWQEFDSAVDWLAKNKEQDSFLVIDSETAYWDWMMYERSVHETKGSKDVGALNFADWGVVKKIDSNIHQKIRALNMDVIAIAHEKAVTNSNDYVNGYVPACNKVLPHSFDVTVRMTKDFDGKRKLSVENRHGDWLMKDEYDVTGKTFFDVFKDDLKFAEDREVLIRMFKIKIMFCRKPEQLQELIKDIFETHRDLSEEDKAFIKDYGKKHLKKLI